jgi:hypothetical protein
MRARDIKLVLYLPPDMFRSETANFAAGRARIDEVNFDAFILQKTDIIIFPEDELHLTDSYGPLISTNRFSTIDIYLSQIYHVRWKIYADDMPPREGRTFLKDIPVTTR